MIKDAVRSLKKDWDRAVFYWIVFVLSSMFMFTFFHLALSDAKRGGITCPHEGFRFIRNRFRVKKGVYAK